MVRNRLRIKLAFRALLVAVFSKGVFGLGMSDGLLLAQEGIVAAAQATDEKPMVAKLPFEPGKNWLRLTRDHEVWLDAQQKQVLVGGRVCLREGLLEMFACPSGTKEHEAVVAVNSPARYVHAGLVALGAKPGTPVQFQPEYRAAQGPEVEVTVIWLDMEGKEHRQRAQEWVKHNKTGKALAYPWVFAGSGFWTDKAAGERFYYADGGELVCVSNFSTAMLDLPVESSDANDTLLFTAFTERIPPRETRVFLLFSPQLKKDDVKNSDVKNSDVQKENAKNEDENASGPGKSAPKAIESQEPGASLQSI